MRQLSEGKKGRRAEDDDKKKLDKRDMGDVKKMYGKARTRDEFPI